jgi:hypothetical protein
MESDWVDAGPDACQARREIYNVCNRRVFTFEGQAFVTEDTTSFMLLGSQHAGHLDYCSATDIVTFTHVDDKFDDLRELLTEHLRVVGGVGYDGPDVPRWLKAAGVCRPELS